MFWINKKALITIVNNDVIKHFIRTYARKDNWHNLQIETGNLGYAWVHYAFIRNLRPDRVLVVGSKFGFIPAICAVACRDNKHGVVDFVDAGFNMNTTQEKRASWGGVGFWKKIDTHKYFDKFQTAAFIETHVTTTNNFFDTYKKRGWKYIYLDGDHSYKGATSDFTRSYPRLEKGGIISLHDIHIKPQGESIYGVWKLWRELKQTKQYNMIELPGIYGVGFIQK